MPFHMFLVILMVCILSEEVWTQQYNDANNDDDSQLSETASIWKRKCPPLVCDINDYLWRKGSRQHQLLMLKQGRTVQSAATSEDDSQLSETASIWKRKCPPLVCD